MRTVTQRLLVTLALVFGVVEGLGFAQAQFARSEAASTPLVETGSISGVVRSADGTAPLANIRVTAYAYGGGPPAPVQIRCTDGAGGYTLPNLALGTYAVDARGEISSCGGNPRYVPEWYHEKRYDTGRSDPITVASSAPVTGIDFTLELGAIISGTVRDLATSLPVPGLPVVAKVVTDTWQAYAGCTDADGRYAIWGVPYAFSYKLYASAAGQGCRGDPRYLTTYYPQTSTWDAAAVITLPPGTDLAAIDFSVEKGGTISGLIGYSGAITGTHRIWVIASITSSPAVYTNILGTGLYTLVGIPDGVYWISAYMDADDDNNPWWGTPGGPPPAPAEPGDPTGIYPHFVTISGHGNVGPADFELGWGNVAGRVNLQGRASHVGVLISVGGALFTATTSVDGTFVRSNAGVGTHTITATMPGYLSVMRGGVVVSEGATTTLSAVTLRGGDADHDDDIDITDLTLLGANFGTTAPATDINGDGSVNIFDIAMVGANFGRAGPTPWP